jgi:hypothetical protein
MFTQLAYETVRSLGIFRRRGPLLGAVAVAFVCQVFYEIFDQIGPRLRWWAWNPDNLVVNHPALASVPMTSMLLYASVSMAALTYLVVRLAGGGRFVPRVLLAGVLTPLAMVIAGLPASLLRGDITAQAWVLGVELALVWSAGGWVIAANPKPVDEPVSAFARSYPAVYLAVMAVFWLSALPGGVPIGSGLYALACFLGAGLVLAALYRVRSRAPATV